MNCAENDFVNGNKGNLKTTCESKNAMEKINNKYALCINSCAKTNTVKVKVFHGAEELFFFPK